jgi:hypothetical protein
MKIKKNTLSTLVLDLFCQSTVNCRKLKIQKSTSPTMQLTAGTGGGLKMHIENFKNSRSFLIAAAAQRQRRPRQHAKIKSSTV